MSNNIPDLHNKFNSYKSRVNTIVLLRAGPYVYGGRFNHHQVEKAMKTKKVCDFGDFIEAIQKAGQNGKVFPMSHSNFFEWEDLTVTMKPILLRDIVTLRVDRGRKTIQHSCTYTSPLRESHVLKLKYRREGIEIPPPIQRTGPRGIDREKHSDIVRHLCPLMPENRRLFWHSLPVSDNMIDLQKEYDD